MFQLSAANRDHGAGAETGTVEVAVASGCPWTATTAAAWIHVMAPAGGNGAGTVNYTIEANPTIMRRNGTITVQGQIFTVTQAGSAIAQEITINLPGDVPLVMVRIPAGTFLMGSLDSERWHLPNEAPQHEVMLTQDYYLGKYEVTHEQWQAVIGANPSWFSYCGQDCPVESVSWDDICGGADGTRCASESFVGKLNQHLMATGQPGGGKLRLPTEAEWEYAVRGGTVTPFSFGDDEGCELNDCSPCNLFAQYMWWCGDADSSGTHPVGQLGANPYGLCDMHGNVREWVADWYGTYSSAPQMDPTGPAAGSNRVIRGGKWGGPAIECRSARRSGAANPGSFRDAGTGFRVARSP